MQFLYHKSAGDEILSLKNEEILHLKARRMRKNELLKLRNLKDDYIFTYEISAFSKNSCTLNLREKLFSPNTQSSLSLALGVIDPKILEKTLPFLNELGIARLILVYCDFSQHSFKIDLNRLEKILISSCEQCGRSQIMQLEIYKNSDEFFTKFPHAILVDFNANSGKFSQNELYFIGPEGGFSARERKKFKRKISIKAKNILKSQSAAIGVAAKILL